MFEAVHRTAIRDADTAIINVQIVETWASTSPEQYGLPVASVDAIVDQFTATITTGYIRQRRQKVRVWGWAALAAFAIAALFNAVVGDVTVRQSIVGPIGLVAVSAFALWLVLRAKAKSRTPQEAATIAATRERLRAAGQAAYYARLRERRRQLLARLAPNTDTEGHPY
jgi:hypothetical protein